MASNYDWGLIERDRDSGQVVGLEFWGASKLLPRELLDALPRLEVPGSSLSRLARGRQSSHAVVGQRNRLTDFRTL